MTTPEGPAGMPETEAGRRAFDHFTDPQSFWGPDVLRQFILAIEAEARAADEPETLPEIDVAWRAVEAALLGRGWDWSVSIEHSESGDGYFEPHYEGFRATAHLGTSMPEFASTVTGDHGETVAAALNALAVRLSRATPTTEDEG